jgi:hypothetical protein
LVKSRSVSGEATAEVVREVFGCGRFQHAKMARVAIPIIKAKPIILFILSPMSAIVVPVAEARHLVQEKRCAAETLMTDQTAELMKLIHELRFNARRLTRRRRGHEGFVAEG